jgi:hypothetical protein
MITATSLLTAALLLAAAPAGPPKLTPKQAVARYLKRDPSGLRLDGFAKPHADAAELVRLSMTMKEHPHVLRLLSTGALLERYTLNTEGKRGRSQNTPLLKELVTVAAGAEIKGAREMAAGYLRELFSPAQLDPHFKTLRRAARSTPSRKFVMLYGLLPSAGKKEILEFLREPETIRQCDPGVRYAVAARHGDKAAEKKLFAEEKRLIAALGLRYTPNLNRILAYAETEAVWNRAVAGLDSKETFSVGGKRRLPMNKLHAHLLSLMLQDVQGFPVRPPNVLCSDKELEQVRKWVAATTYSKAIRRASPAKALVAEHIPERVKKLLKELDAVPGKDQRKLLEKWARYQGEWRKPLWDVVRVGAGPDQDTKLRLKACYLASRLSVARRMNAPTPKRNPDAILPLLTCLGSDDYRLVNAAASALSGMSRSGRDFGIKTKALPILKRILTSEDAQMVWAGTVMVAGLDAYELAPLVIRAWERHEDDERVPGNCLGALKVLLRLKASDQLLAARPELKKRPDPRETEKYRKWAAPWQESRQRCDKLIKELGKDRAKWYAYWRKLLPKEAFEGLPPVTTREKPPQPGEEVF